MEDGGMDEAVGRHNILKIKNLKIQTQLRDKINRHTKNKDMKELGQSNCFCAFLRKIFNNTHTSILQNK